MLRSRIKSLAFLSKRRRFRIVFLNAQHSKTSAGFRYAAAAAYKRGGGRLFLTSSQRVNAASSERERQTGEKSARTRGGRATSRSDAQKSVFPKVDARCRRTRKAAARSQLWFLPSILIRYVAILTSSRCVRQNLNFCNRLGAS